MPTPKPDADQRALVFAHLLDGLQNTLGHDAEHKLAHPLLQTPAALRLLVDDPDTPIWGIALAELDVFTRDQLALFRAQPALNMMLDGEACISLAEWLENLKQSFAFQQKSEARQQALDDRKFFRTTFKSNSCDDLPRFRRLLIKELATEGVQISLQALDGQTLNAEIFQDSQPAQGVIWKNWAASINQIQLSSSEIKRLAGTPRGSSHDL
jgi:hypothetical protein